MPSIDEIIAKFNGPHVTHLKLSVLSMMYRPKLLEIAKLGKLISEADPTECSPESLRVIMRKLIAELEAL
jgi:hypothetical protein